MWFQNLLRPTIKSVHVILYENGKEKDISKFDDFRHNTLCKAINFILKTDDHSPFWFETDLFEHRSCFKPTKTTLEVTCYMQDKYNPAAKKRVNVPPRYRKKLFDKRHSIHPEQFSAILWPSTLEVAFTHTEKSF